MKRNSIRLLCCLLLSALLVCPVFASAVSERVIDNADLLTDSEEEALSQKAQVLIEQYGMDVVILTEDSLNGQDRESYADDYYDNHGYGVGERSSGVLLLIAMDTREWYISTCGDAIYALTDYGIESVFSRMSGDLSGGYYYDAFDSYLDALAEHFAAYAAGDPIDGYAGSYDGPGDYEPGTQEYVVHYGDHKGRTAGDYVKMVLIGLAIGAVAGIITVGILRSKMNTAKQQKNAASYLVGGSYDLQNQQDIFLYSHVTRTRRSDDSSGGHGGGHSGGGSSVHTSSGGHSHGGGGGHF